MNAVNSDAFLDSHVNINRSQSKTNQRRAAGCIGFSDADHQISLLFTGTSYYYYILVPSSIKNPKFLETEVNTTSQDSDHVHEEAPVPTPGSHQRRLAVKFSRYPQPNPVRAHRRTERRPFCGLHAHHRRHSDPFPPPQSPHRSQYKPQTCFDEKKTIPLALLPYIVILVIVIWISGVVVY